MTTLIDGALKNEPFCIIIDFLKYSQAFREIIESLMLRNARLEPS